MSQIPSITAKSVAEAAKAGDKTAAEVYNITGEMLGRGLSVLIDILNPDKIVIGSIYARSSELMTDAMNRVIKEETLKSTREAVEILPAKLGESIGDYAALALALDCYERSKEI